MARNNNRGRNNNPTGKNQYSNSWMDTARERPIAAAATAAAAVGAGVFLWSKRNQISEQLSTLSDQISDWTENMRPGDDSEFETMDAGGLASSGATGSTSARTSRSTGSRPTATRGSSSSGNSSRRSTSGMSETGGGNASLGAHSGGSGVGNG